MRIIVPNPHEGDIDPTLIRRILYRIGRSAEQWNKV
jgi:hypothetical protein